MIMPPLRTVLTWVWEHAEKLLGAIALVVALLAFSLARVQLTQANQAAWDYSGGSQCSDYRGQVLELWKLGLNEEEIKNWFGDEAGGALNRSGPTSNNKKAIDDFEDNCGAVATLLSHLPSSPPPP
jgi:hypothetical protein